MTSFLCASDSRDCGFDLHIFSNPTLTISDITPQQTKGDQSVAIIEAVQQTDDLAIIESSITFDLSVYNDLDEEP